MARNKSRLARGDFNQAKRQPQPRIPGFNEDWHEAGQERERASICPGLNRITMFASPTFAEQQDVPLGSEAERQDCDYLTKHGRPVYTTPSGVALYR